MFSTILIVLAVVLQITANSAEIELKRSVFGDKTKVVQVKRSANTEVLRSHEFLKQHSFREFSVNSEELRLKDNFALSNTGNTAYKYEQFVNGLRLVGAELVVIESQIKGVMRAKAQGIRDDASQIMENSIDAIFTDGRASIREHMKSKYKSQTEFEMDISSQEMVYYQSFGAKTLIPTKAIEMIGSSVVDIDGLNYGLAYTAYIDAETGKVLDYVARGEPKVGTTRAKKSRRALRGSQQAGHSSKTLEEITGGVEDFDDFANSEIIVYDCLGFSSCPSSPDVIWRSSGVGTDYDWPTNDEKINKAVAVTVQYTRLMRAISNQEWKTFGRTDRELKIHLNINMVNAYYNGVGIFFGEELVADDVIAHEWAHGYCDYSSNLVYFNQSGALNEANSDQYGESIDILNSQSAETAMGDVDMVRMADPRQLVQDCNIDNWQYQQLQGNDSSRWWIIGEDIDRDTLGAIRDMYKPECFGFAGSMDSSDFYCGSQDNMGVHMNSGVGNRLFALSVQGGTTSDGTSLPGLGWTKTLSLMWNTQLAISSNTDYMEYHDEIKFQCNAIIGTTLLVADWETGDSNEDTTNGLVSQADCDNLDLILEETKIAYPVQYVNGECVFGSSAPTMDPTGPTQEPTLIPPPPPQQFDPYTASGTNNANVNTVNEELYVCAGTTITFDTGCDCTYDTYLRLVDQAGTEYTSNDDECGRCSKITHTFTQPCRWYILKQGCWLNTACGAQVTLTISLSEIPTLEPTKSPVTNPTRLPTKRPTRLPTEAPNNNENMDCTRMLVYKSKTKYAKKQIVQHQEKAYKSLQRNNVKKSPGKAPKWWKEIGTCDPLCENKPFWKKTKTYPERQLVIRKGDLFQAKKSSTNKISQKNKKFWLKVKNCE